MVVGLLGSEAHVSLPLEQLVDEILGVGGDVVPDRVAVGVRAAKEL